MAAANILNFHYDKRDPLVEKKVSGKGWEYLVYGRLDRLVAMQDQNLKLSNYWISTKYDIYNRVAMTGRATSELSRKDLQAQLDGLVNLYLT